MFVFGYCIHTTHYGFKIIENIIHPQCHVYNGTLFTLYMYSKMFLVSALYFCSSSHALLRWCEHVGVFDTKNYVKETVTKKEDIMPYYKHMIRTSNGQCFCLFDGYRYH